MGYREILLGSWETGICWGHGKTRSKKAWEPKGVGTGGWEKECQNSMPVEKDLERRSSCRRHGMSNGGSAAEKRSSGPSHLSGEQD